MIYDSPDGRTITRRVAIEYLPEPETTERPADNAGRFSFDAVARTAIALLMLAAGVIYYLP